MEGKRFGFLGIKLSEQGYTIYRTYQFLKSPGEVDGVNYGRWIQNIRENYHESMEQEGAFQAWIVPLETTGPWVGHEQEIAIWNKDRWEFFEAMENDAVFVKDEQWETQVGEGFEDQVGAILVEGFFYYDITGWKRFEKIETKQVWIEGGRDDYGISVLTLGGIVGDMTHDVVLGVVTVGNEEGSVDGEQEGETIRIRKDYNVLFLDETEACRKTIEEDDIEKEVRPALATTDGIIQRFSTEDTETVAYKEVDLIATRGGRIIFVQTTDEIVRVGDIEIPIATTDGYLSQFSCEDIGWVVQVVYGRIAGEEIKKTEAMRFTNAV